MSDLSTLGRDILVRVLFVTLLVGVPVLLVLDYRLFPGHFLEHLPDHLLALIAIAAGLVAIYYDRKLEKRFDRQKQELNSSFARQRDKLDRGFDEQRIKIQGIVESMSTRFLGIWPVHLEEITALTGTATEELIISVDTIGYGHFSNHEKFLEYFAELERAEKRGVSIKMLLPPEEMCRKSLELQFEKEKREPESEACTKLLRDYQDMYGDRLGFELRSFDDFLDADLYIESSYCAQLVDKIISKVDKTIPSPIEVAVRVDQKSHEPVYYWIVRRNGIPKEAIFAYPRFVGVGKGYSFRTLDPRLMDIFSSDFNAKWGKAVPINSEKHLYPKAWEARDWRSGKAQAGRAGA